MIVADDDRGQGRIDFASPSITGDDVAAVERVLRSGWLTTGAECEAFERELEDATGAPFAVAVSSCTAALEIALAALKPAAGSIVVVPTWTFVSTGLSAYRAGCRPMLVDVEPATLNIDPDGLERALACHDVAAVMPVHIGGVPVDPAIYDLCRAAGVPVIEDAAHALGATDHRGPLNGKGSAAACLSFYVTKNLAAGEGGALLTWDEDVANFARSYRLHGLDRDAWARYRPGARTSYELLHPGIKANFPDLLAALARSQLRRFPAMQRRRRELVGRYREGVAQTEVRPLPAEQVDGSADHLFTVELPRGVDRSAVQATLDEAGISTSVHFRPLHRYRWFRDNALMPDTGLRVADRMTPRVLSLPLHPNLGFDDVDRVCSVLARATHPSTRRPSAHAEPGRG